MDDSSKTGQQPQVSYQDVPFKKKTWFNGDADAGLAVTLNVAAKQKQKEKHHNLVDEKLLNQRGETGEGEVLASS